MADSHRRTARLSQRSLTSPWLTLPLALLLGACATTVTPSATAPTSAPTASQQASAPAASQQPVAAPEQSELRTLATLQDRLYRVSAPLLVNNTDLCRVSARNLLGFTAKNRFSYSAELANAASSMLGLDDRLQVTGVLPGSGAARAGVKRGDFLLSVEDRPLPQGENAERHAATVLAPLVTRRSNVKMTIQRDGNMAELLVEDDGAGISPADRERVIDRGVRLDSGKPGTGLGLAIVRDVAEIYGGSIALEESEDLGGLLVRLRLPAG